MKQPILIEGQAFDWDEGARLAERHGGANTIRGALFVDPGVMSCPGCDEMLWREGIRVQCPHCGHQWEVAKPGPMSPRALRKRIAEVENRGPRTEAGRRAVVEELSELRRELAQRAQEAAALGLGEDPLVAPGVRAVVFDTPKGIYIPIISAERPGCGDVARYLDALPADRRVVFPTVVSARLRAMLERRGFRPSTEWAEEFQQHVDIYERTEAP